MTPRLIVPCNVYATTTRTHGRLSVAQCAGANVVAQRAKPLQRVSFFNWLCKSCPCHNGTLCLLVTSTAPPVGDAMWLKIDTAATQIFSVEEPRAEFLVECRQCSKSATMSQMETLSLSAPHGSVARKCCPSRFSMSTMPLRFTTLLRGES